MLSCYSGHFHTHTHSCVICPTSLLSSTPALTAAYALTCLRHSLKHSPRYYLLITVMLIITFRPIHCTCVSLVVLLPHRLCWHVAWASLVRLAYGVYLVRLALGHMGFVGMWTGLALVRLCPHGLISMYIMNTDSYHLQCFSLILCPTLQINNCQE